MLRITEQSMLNRNVNAIRRNFNQMEASSSRLSTGKRVNAPHENVTATVNSIYFRARIHQINQFEENIVEVEGRLNVVHDGFSSLTQVMHRMREITVQGANGTYTEQDRVAMAMEVEEMLHRAHEISGMQYKGEYVFSGYHVKRPPFTPQYQHDEKLGNKIVGMEYHGDGGFPRREIENGEFVDTSIPGNYGFWGTDSELTTSKDLSGFIASRDQKVMIDDMIVEIARGDNIDAIVDKINAMGGNVKAESVIMQGGAKVLQLSSREPHKILVRDLEGGTLFQDIGLIRPGMGNFTEANYDPSVSVGGKSLFEIGMFVRDALLANNIAELGQDALGFLDAAMNNMLHSQSKISSRMSHIESAARNFSDELTHIESMLSKNEDVDYSEEIVNFKMWEYVHKASLQTSAKLMQPTLMDYLR